MQEMPVPAQSRVFTPNKSVPVTKVGADPPAIVFSAILFFLETDLSASTAQLLEQSGRGGENPSEQLVQEVNVERHVRTILKTKACTCTTEIYTQKCTAITA